MTGNLFGKEIEGSIPVKMNRLEVDRILKTDHKGSQIMLDVEGTAYDVLIKEIDYNSMARRVDEIDFRRWSATKRYILLPLSRSSTMRWYRRARFRRC